MAERPYRKILAEVQYEFADVDFQKCCFSIMSREKFYSEVGNKGLEQYDYKNISFAIAPHDYLENVVLATDELLHDFFRKN